MPVTISVAPGERVSSSGDVCVFDHSKEWGRKFSARMMKPGLMSYTDIGGGVALLKKETIDQCISSYIGKPLVIKHNAVDPHTGEVVGRPTPENMEDVAVGYISDVTLEGDGWYWAHGVCHNDEAKALIKKGWRVSHTFSNPRRGPAGTEGGIPYTHSWESFTGEHLALVPNPRYEEATIVLHSRAETKAGERMFKLFRSKKAEEATNAATQAAADKLAADKAAEQKAAEEAANHSKGEAVELGADTLVEVGEGKTAPLGELIAKFNEAAVDHAECSPDDEFEVANYGKVKLCDLMAGYVAHAEAMKEDEEAKKKASADHSKKPAVIRVKPFDALVNAEAIAHAKRLRDTSSVPDDRETQAKRAADRFKGVTSFAASAATTSNN